MAKPLVFQLGESEFSFAMNKIDRSKLYGFKEVVALDESDQKCDLATLAGDGCTLIGRGGTGLGWLDADGSWCDKSQLTPIDKDGSEIQPVPSSFSGSIRLFDTVTVEEYLEHNIRLVYSMDALGEADELISQLNRGTIFRFSYSYRGGLEADTAFLLTNQGGEIMMAVGTPTQVEFIGIAAPAATVDESGRQDDEAETHGL